MTTATTLRDDLIAYTATIDKTKLNMAELTAYASLVEKLMEMEKGDLCERIFSTPPFSEMLADMRASFQQPVTNADTPVEPIAAVGPMAFGGWN